MPSFAEGTLAASCCMTWSAVGGVDNAGSDGRTDGELVELGCPALFGPGLYRSLRSFSTIQPCVVNFLRCAISESGVDSPGIIAELDVLGDIGPGTPSCRVDGAMDPLVLQRGKERFGHRIIIAYAGSTDRLPHPVFREGRGEAGRRVVGRFKGSSQHCCLRGTR